MVSNKLVGIFFAGVFIFGHGFSAAPASAQTIASTIEPLLTNHNRIAAAQQDLEAANEGVGVAWGGWTPDLSLTGDAGFEHQTKPASANTDLQPRQVTASITQNLYDFGATSAAIDAAKLEVDRSSTVLTAVRQTLILDAATASLRLIRAQKILKFANALVANLEEQAKRQDDLIAAGKGSSTDALLTKRSLAGARSLRVNSEGAVQQAMNRYLTIFGYPMAEGGVAKKIAINSAILPETLDAAIEAAFKANATLKVSQIATQTAEQTVNGTRAREFAPTVNAVLSSAMKNDYAGTAGYKGEYIAKVEVNFPFDLGLTGVNSLSADQARLSAANSRWATVKRRTEEAVRNAWSQLETADKSIVFLDEQETMAENYLANAREELKLGKRPLLDVLTGESSFLSAQSDAESARIDRAVAALTLLQAVGGLNMETLQTLLVETPG